MADAFDQIEAAWPEGPWVFGDRYSVADPYLFTVAEWLAGDGVEVSRYPKVLAHRAVMLARPAVQRARVETTQAA